MWPIDKIQLGATTPDQSHLGAMVMKEYSAFLIAQALLVPHNQII